MWHNSYNQENNVVKPSVIYNDYSGFLKFSQRSDWQIKLQYDRPIIPMSFSHE